MDKNTLLQEAVNEANDELSEYNLENYKKQIKDAVYQISQNNKKILLYQEENIKIQKRISSLDFKELKRIKI